MSQDVRYRPDIDGLRTIAIVPVVLFHAGVNALSGGYVGVDVFFVISGFLITGIIAREVDERRFSIVIFYERRIRRIMPALVTVILFVMAGTAWLFLPDAFRAVPRSIVATLAFVSNVNFWMESDYFGAAAKSKPLLHTWSLAVEEQFYIAFPILLIVIGRYRPRWRKAILWMVAILSFAASLWLTKTRPTFSFYLLPSRTWELMTGALLAVGALPAVREQTLREILAVAGLTAIGVAVFAYTEATPFPGAAALLPVLGSAALIHVGQSTVIGRFLSLKPIVGIGLISYSLYMWHWPIIVFIENARAAPLEGIWTVVAITASIAVGGLSWRFIERPFRDRERVSKRFLFVMFAATNAALLTIVGAAFALHGWPQRFSPQVLELAGQVKDFSPDRALCHREPNSWNKAPCVLGAPNAVPSVVLWGDSHGVELAYALSQIARQHDTAIIERTLSSCTPVFTVVKQGDKACARFNAAVLRDIEASPTVRTVVLAGYWAVSRNRTNYGLPENLVRTVRRLRTSGRQVVIVTDYPNQHADVPLILARAAQNGTLDRSEGVQRPVFEAKIHYLASALAQARALGARVEQPADALCRGTRCDIYRDGHALYFDRHHLSNAGARIVADHIAPSVFGTKAL